MDNSQFQALTIRVPTPLHQAARIKGIKIGKSLNAVLNEKLAEWVKEEPQPPAAAQKAKGAK